MKSIYKLFFFFFLATQFAHSREIILIENQSSLRDGENLKKLLVQKFNLPSELISLNQIKGKCQFYNEAIIYLCLDPEGELHIGKMNHYVVRNSLGVFLKDVNWSEL